jgi:hypothetical protein
LRRSNWPPMRRRMKAPGNSSGVNSAPSERAAIQADPDQTALELLATFMAQYPGVYQMHHLRTLQRRVKAWRRDAVERLIGSMHEFTPSVSPEACR